jgi:membrane-bound ClpP family serine protease
MTGHQILLLEVYTAFLFSLEYFLYKNQIDLLEVLFSERLDKETEGIFKSYQRSIDDLKNINHLRMIFKIFLILFTYWIIYKLYAFGVLIPSDMVAIVLYFSISFIYLFFILPIKYHSLMYEKVVYLIMKYFTYLLKSFKRGTIVGLGVICLILSFIGKYTVLEKVNSEIVSTTFTGVIGVISIFFFLFMGICVQIFLKWRTNRIS